MATPSHLQPSPDKAASALLRIRQKGLMKAFAIDPNAKGSAPVGKTFEMPGEREDICTWIVEQILT
jgi:hypothetical protein